MWQRAAIGRAAAIVRAGGIVAYPTEGVFGFGCDPLNRHGVKRICALKQRPLSAGLLLLASNLDQLPGWIDPDAQELDALMTAVNQPTTWIVRAGPLATPWITGGRDTIGVRISGHPPATALCEAAGMPLVSTSANRRGRPPAKAAIAVRRQFGQSVDFVLGGPTGGWNQASEIRVAATGECVRSG